MKYFYMFFFAFLISCSNDSNVLIEVQPEIGTTWCGVKNLESELELIWCNYIEEDSTSRQSACLPVLYENLLIFPASLGPDGKQKLYFMNKNSGDYIRILDVDSTKNFINTLTVYRDKLLIDYSTTGVDCLDLITFEKIWSYDTNSMEYNFNMVVFEDELYLNVGYGHDSTTIYKFDILTGNKQRLFAIGKDEVNGKIPRVGGLKLQRLDSGDLICCFTMSCSQLSGPSDMNLWCYNLSMNGYLWQNTNVFSEGTIQRGPPAIHDGVILILGRTASGYDLLTGDLLYEIPIEPFNEFRLTYPLQIGGFLYGKGAQESLVAIDIKAGIMIWHNKASGAWTQDRLTHYNGRLYYSGLGTTMRVIDLSSGEVLYNLESPFDFGGFYLSGQVIDEEKQIIYSSDKYRMLAFKIPE